MKLLVNSKSKGEDQERSPAKKKLSEFAPTLKKVDVGAALRTMRAAFTLAVDWSTLACVASGAAACVLASLLIERCDFARSVSLIFDSSGWLGYSVVLSYRNAHRRMHLSSGCRHEASPSLSSFSRCSRPCRDFRKRRVASFRDFPARRHAFVPDSLSRTTVLSATI